MYLFWTPERPVVQFRLDHVVEVTGWVSRTPEIRGDSIYFELSPDMVRQQGRNHSYSGRIAVWLDSPKSGPQTALNPPLRYGEILRFTTLLREPSYYAIPGVQDQRWIAWLQGTPFAVRLKSPLQLERLGDTWLGFTLGPFFDYLNSFENQSRKTLKIEQLRLIQGVFLGRKRSLEHTEKESIRDLGILHLFVVSGFHISLIVFLLHGLLKFFGRPGRFLTIAAIWLYILGIGLPLASVRAGVIASLSYILISLGLSRNLLNGLGISALIIAAASPRSVFSSSFHLSYVCLCAIGILVLPLMKYVLAVRRGIEDLHSPIILLGRNPEWALRRSIRFSLERVLPVAVIVILKRPMATTLSYLLTLLACSLCIQLLLFPVSIYYTNRWSWTQGFSNLLLMPLFSVLIALCFLFFLTYWTPFAPLIAGCLDTTANLCRSLIGKLAIYSPVLYLPHPRVWEILIYFLLVLTLGLALSRKSKSLVLLAPVFLLLSLNLPLEDINAGNLVLTMLDVGQGECIHLRYPNGKDALIDTGGLAYPSQSNFVGDRLVSRYLWQLRSSNLSYVLITHSDADHKTGYRFLQRAFPISRLLYFVLQPEYSTPRRQLSQGNSFSFSGVKHLIHHPAIEESARLTSNNSSIVLTLFYGDFSILLTGDIETPIEHRLLPLLTPVTVLKLAHHGSKTSTSLDLLEAVRPRVGIVSAGRKHTFGHPSPAVLARLEQCGAEVFSTPKFGTLRLITDGLSWRIQHYSIQTGAFEDILGTEPLVDRSDRGLRKDP